MICVSKEDLLKTCLDHISAIITPVGYSVDTFVIRDSKSMASAYNQALSHEAKYKIYIHQDTFILNKNILFELLVRFQSEPLLGLMGMSGCRDIPWNGIWWQTGSDFVGNAYSVENGKIVNDYNYTHNHDPHKLYEEVMYIDGFFMATQYDVPWREDLFDHYHFYDASQSLEFRKRGYRIGVPYQKDAWSIHYREPGLHKEQENEFYKYHEVFLQYRGEGGVL